jgi:predicted TPR repeat methyltransferase
MDGRFEQAREFFLRGVDDFEAGRLEQAERNFAASLALLPGRPSTLTNLGAVRLRLGRAEEALALLEEALAQEPGNAEALGHCATALAELGRHAEALAVFDRALAAQPKAPSLWTLRGSVLRDLGRLEEAAASYERAIQHGGDAALNGYYLAGLGRAAAPPNAPAHYVEALFDGYAGQFDDHLVQALGYDAPRILAARLAGLGRRFTRALDLGCGTGLCGPLLQPLCDAVDGVDLSAKMLEQARRSGAYAQLQQADAGAFLAQPTQRYELVVAADVFVYVGALDAVFEGVARAMPAGGVFCFTVEAASEAERLVLRPSLRYAHSRAYLRELAARYGFRELAVEERPVREDQRVPIPGLFVWLEKTA